MMYIIPEELIREFRRVSADNYSDIAGHVETLAFLVGYKLDDNLIGNILWSFIFSFGVVFPLALNRSISALRHASYFSFFCGFYVVLVIVITCLSDRDVVPDLSKSLKEAAVT